MSPHVGIAPSSLPFQLPGADAESGPSLLRLGETLFPAEQARISPLLINRVTLSQAELTGDLRTERLGSLIRDMLAPPQQAKDA